MIPSRLITADIKESIWDNLSVCCVMGQFDELVEILDLLPTIQSEQLRGYNLDSVAKMSPAGCIRVYLKKKTGAGKKDNIAIDLYADYELEDEWLKKQIMPLEIE